MPLAAVLERKAFDLDRVLEIEPSFMHEGAVSDHDHDDDDGEDHHDQPHAGLKHHQDEEIQSISLQAAELRPLRFLPWLQALIRQQGANILRSKGILAFLDDPQQFVLQGIHMLVDAKSQRRWGATEPRRSKLVLIGRHLDAARIRNGFDRCIVM